MRKKYFVLFFVSFLIFSGFPYAKAEEDSIPEGMEHIKVGGAEFLVPKGTKVRKKGDLYVMENISEYSARKFMEAEEQFQSIEVKYSNLKEETKENSKLLEKKQEKIEKTLAHIKKELKEIKEILKRKIEI